MTKIISCMRRRKYKAGVDRFYSQSVIITNPVILISTLTETARRSLSSYQPYNSQLPTDKHPQKRTERKQDVCRIRFRQGRPRQPDHSSLWTERPRHWLRRTYIPTKCDHRPFEGRRGPTSKSSWAPQAVHHIPRASEVEDSQEQRPMVQHLPWQSSTVLAAD